QRHDRVIGIVAAEEEDANECFVARWNRSRRRHRTDQREPVKTADERSPAEQATGAVAQEISARLFHNVPPTSRSGIPVSWQSDTPPFAPWRDCSRQASSQ